MPICDRIHVGRENEDFCYQEDKFKFVSSNLGLFYSKKCVEFLWKVFWDFGKNHDSCDTKPLFAV